MKLNARQVGAAKPREKTYRLTDGADLYLKVVPPGSRYWWMKYRFNGKEKRVVFGVYPAVSLAQAGALRDGARKKLAEGIDPSFAKKEEKLARDVQLNSMLQFMTLEWYGTKMSRWPEGCAPDILEAFSRDIFPYIDQLPVNEIKPLVLFNVLRRVESRGATEKTKKVRQHCSEVFRYAIVTSRAEYSPAAGLTSAMSGHESEHYPFLTVEELPDFFETLAGYTGSPLVVLAVRLLIITGVRTGELQGAFWSEFDLEKAVWEIPTECMKMKRPHLVPLSTQALEIVQQLKMMTGQYPLVFPGRNDPRKTMSEVSINQVLKRIGYTGKVIGRGFRHTMNIILYEEGFNTAWIETQLTHVDKNAIRGTYNHALYLEGRREMMQWYVDYIGSIGLSGLIITSFNTTV